MASFDSLPIQIIPIDKLNRDKEVSRYRFVICQGGGWSVWRKSTFVGIYHDSHFEAVTGYENLSHFIASALIRQYKSARENIEFVSRRTQQLFGLDRASA